MGVEQVACDLCGADDYIVLFEGQDRLHHKPGRFPIVKCKNCQLVYLNPRPDIISLPHYYPEDYAPFAHGRGLVGKVQVLLRRLEALRISRFIPEQGRILEVGCAAGDLLVPLREHYRLDVAGIEMSLHAASLAKDVHGLDVHCGTLFDAPYARASFDAVVMRHVVEHFPSARQALEEIGRLLKPGGKLFITTPNYNSIDRRVFRSFWHNYEPPRHLAVFSVATLERLLGETGFALQGIDHSMVPNDWVHSTKYLLEGLGLNTLARLFTIKNPLILLFFLPFGVVQKLLKKSGRIQVRAVKRS